MITRKKITKEDLKAAKIEAQELGLLKNSIELSHGNVAGILGEIMFSRLIGGARENTYDYDVISKKGFTFDVKTKRTSVKPKSYYQCSVADFNTRQKCDYYAFCRVDYSYENFWMLGYIKKDDFYNNAIFYKAGDKEGDNGFIIKADCYNIPISSLIKYTE